MSKGVDFVLARKINTFASENTEPYATWERIDRMDNNKGFIVRRLSQNEIPAALELAWKVFSEYESPDYAPEGTEEFRKCLHDEEYLAGIEYYGAFDGEKLIGTIGIRADKKHICFFFVDGNYHRKGIGTGMFRYLLKDYSGKTITLNSSPYGVPFYRAIGFVPTDEEKTVNGIRFTPMEYKSEAVNKGMLRASEYLN